MIFVKVLWSLLINLDLIVIALFVFGTLRKWCNKTCSMQKPVMSALDALATEVEKLTLFPKIDASKI